MIMKHRGVTQGPSVVSILRRPAGSQPTIVFFPGLNGNVGQWQPLLNIVDRELPAVGVVLASPILRGPRFGGQTPSIPNLRAALAIDLAGAGVGDLILVAHSVGAFVATEYAVRHPTTVRGVVLLNGGLAAVAQFLNAPLTIARARPRLAFDAARLFLLTGLPVPRVWKRLLAASGTLSTIALGRYISKRALADPVLRRIVVEDVTTSGVYAALWRNRHHWRRFIAEAPRLGTPLVMLCGDADPVAGVADTMDTAATFGVPPKIRVLNGIGHAIPVEAAAAAAREIVEAVRRVA